MPNVKDKISQRKILHRQLQNYIQHFTEVVTKLHTTISLKKQLQNYTQLLYRDRCKTTHNNSFTEIVIKLQITTSIQRQLQNYTQLLCRDSYKTTHNYFAEIAAISKSRRL